MSVKLLIGKLTPHWMMGVVAVAPALAVLLIGRLAYGYGGTASTHCAWVVNVAPPGAPYTHHVCDDCTLVTGDTYKCKDAIYVTIGSFRYEVELGVCQDQCQND
jgi:hypothetical protein